MAKFHAVLMDELGDEFGLEVEADCKFAARRKLRENYPESRVVDLKSNLEMYHRQRRFERAAQLDYDLDYDRSGDY